MTTDHLIIEWCHRNAPPPETVIDWTKVAIQNTSVNVRINALRESTDRFQSYSPIVEKKTLDPEPSLQFVEDALMFSAIGENPVVQEIYTKTNLKYNFDIETPPVVVKEKKEKPFVSDIQIPIEDSNKTKLVLPGSPAKRVKLSSEEELPLRVEEKPEIEEDKMDLQVEEDNMELQVEEEEDKMELEVLSHSSSEQSPLDKDEQEEEKSEPLPNLPLEVLNLYPIGPDDTPPNPDEYEEQNETEIPAVKNKPTRTKKEVKRYEDEQTPPDSEVEEDGDGNKIEKTRKPKKGEIVVLQDVKQNTITIATKKEAKNEGKHNFVTLDLVNNDHVTKIIKDKTQYKSVPFPNFSKFEANAIQETSEYKIWISACVDAYTSAFHVITGSDSFVAPTRPLAERGISHTKPFTQWCETVTDTCRTNLPDLPFCQREPKEEEKEPTMPILYLVFQYQNMIARDFSKHVFFVMFTNPIEENIPKKRAFKVDYHTYFQLKALHSAIRPFDMLIEIWINWLCKHIDNLIEEQKKNPPENPKNIITKIKEKKKDDVKEKKKEDIKEKEKDDIVEKERYHLGLEIAREIAPLAAKAITPHNKDPYKMRSKMVEAFKLWWWYQNIFGCNFVENIVNKYSGDQVLAGRPVQLQY